MSGRPLHALTHCLFRSVAALQAVAEGQSADLPELLTHEAGAAKRTRYGSCVSSTRRSSPPDRREDNTWAETAAPTKPRSHLSPAPT
jgi:hypothetical protein